VHHQGGAESLVLRVLDCRCRVALFPLVGRSWCPIDGGSESAFVRSAPLVGAQQVHRLRLEGARAELMHKWRVLDAPTMTQ
jgi:hypothetical protein